MECFLILVMIAGGTHAFLPVAETKCNASASASQIASPCSVILGGSVYVQVMTNASGYQLRCKKELPSGPMIVFSVKKERVTIQEEFKNRTEFFINNGTLKITNVERNDSGQYSVEVFDPNGVQVNIMSFNLDVKENIFPILIPVCAALGALLILVCCFCCCCCVCRAVKRRKKSGASV